MLDRTSKTTAAAYLETTIRLINWIREYGCEPWLVLHEANDAHMIDELRAEAGGQIPVLDIDASETKGVFGSCRAVIASRYHALISSLSHGTPVLGMSWSHKYERLFQEFEHSRYLIKFPISDDDLYERLGELLSLETGKDIKANLINHSQDKKDRVRQMWDEVNTSICA
ncbi:hypothetical protein A9995_15395 [Erythrobacter sp. QSSC1-22B]|nr:hypothetical protein A9995_15395 [Erythrobacter sp. QSSC1-22B]